VFDGTDVFDGGVFMTLVLVTVVVCPGVVTVVVPPGVVTVVVPPGVVTVVVPPGVVIVVVPPGVVTVVVSPVDQVTTRSLGVASPVKIHRIGVPAATFWQLAASDPLPFHVHDVAVQVEPPASAFVTLDDAMAPAVASSATTSKIITVRWPLLALRNLSMRFPPFLEVELYEGSRLAEKPKWLRTPHI
jgi:hypothetical protein